MSESSDNAVHDSSATLSPTSNSNHHASGAGSSGGGAATGQVADFGLFVNYIKQFVPVLLDTSSASNAEFEKTLGEKSNVECLKKFLGDTQTKNLIFQKFFTKGFTFAHC
jgi:hypothetical protein